jgi:hypothetical protein
MPRPAAWQVRFRAGANEGRADTVKDGTGLVEAGCKSVNGHRLKRAGMHWTVNGAAAIAALCCQQTSRSEGQIRTARRNQVRSTLAGAPPESGVARSQLVTAGQPASSG